MWKFLRLLLCFCLLLTWAARMTIGQTETLGSIRQKYVGHDVVVGGTVGKADGQDVLIDWWLAHRDGDRYLGDIEHSLPAIYHTKTAKVIAVQLEHPKTGQERNALGEPINEDKIVDPSVEFVVQFDDGTVAISSSDICSDCIELSTVQNSFAEKISTQLPSIIGKHVYAGGFSKLYSANATLEEINGKCQVTDTCELPVGKIELVPLTDFPLLQPLKITAAKYVNSDPDQLFNGVVLKVKLPNGNETLAFTSETLLKDPSSRNKPFLERVSGTLFPKIPHEFTAREVGAIRDGVMFRGMSKRAVEYLLGAPDKINDWGSGGKQLIYPGSTFVYVDNLGKVSDWQLLGNK